MELTQADIHAKDLLTLLEAETFKSDAEAPAASAATPPTSPNPSRSSATPGGWAAAR
jgi:hypothetical protein